MCVLVKDKVNTFRSRTLFLVVVLPGLAVVCHQVLRLVLLTYKHTPTHTRTEEVRDNLVVLISPADQRRALLLHTGVSVCECTCLASYSTAPML